METGKAAAGMAKSIRASDEDSEYDLAGYTEAQVTSLMQAAFTEPVALSTMLRHTFVVGGGKKVRQKYDDKLPKWTAAALRAMGYAEDQAAATEISCAASYKQQHDTGQDLKFFHVYPRATLTTAAAGGSGGAEESGSSSLASLGSPSYLATACAFETFKKMVAAKTQSWSQRKRLAGELKASSEQLTALEAKMMAAKPLTAEEQELYDLTSTEALAEKVAWLEVQLKAMVEAGTLTAGEKQQLGAQMGARAEALAGEAAVARSEGKEKKALKLEEQLGAVEARRAKVAAVEAVRHPLKHEDAVKQLRVAIAPLLALEAGPGLRSMEEMKKIGTRPGMEDEVSRLEVDSRGWFEEDEEFAARCALVAASAEAKAKKKSGEAAKKAAAPKGKASDSWETVGSMGTTAQKYNNRR